jgi:DNA-binding MarR family transcriptional regulator
LNVKEVSHVATKQPGDHLMTATAAAPGLTGRAATALRALILAAQEFRIAWAAQLEIGVIDTYALSYLADGPNTPGQLARELGITTGSVTGLVDRLEMTGLARREPRPGDRRAMNVVLTEEGAAAIEIATGHTSAAMHSLGEERLVEVCATLEKLAAALRGEGADLIENDASSQPHGAA